MNLIGKTLQNSLENSVTVVLGQDEILTPISLGVAIYASVCVACLIDIATRVAGDAIPPIHN